MRFSSEVLKKVFSPLRYLSLPQAGIDISDSSVKYLEFADERGRLVVKNFGEYRFPKNILERGDLVGGDDLKKALSGIRDKLSAKLVRASIAEEKSYIFEIKIPYVAPSEIRQAIEFRLEENIPFKADQVAFEFTVLKADKEADFMLLSVSAIPKDVIETYLGVFEAAGLFPISFEVKSRMAARAVVPKNEKSGLVVLHLKDESSTLALVENGVVLFTTTVPVGDNAIERAMKKTAPENGDGEGNYAEALGNVFSVLKDETEKFLAYVQSNPKAWGGAEAGRIARIVLAGRFADLPRLRNQIGQNLGETDVVVGNVWANCFDFDRYVPPIPSRDALAYAAAVGLAMPRSGGRTVIIP